MTLNERLKKQHAEILRNLEESSTLPASELIDRLQSLGPAVIAHLETKDGLYALARKVLTERGDAGGAQLLAIFEQNMRVLAAGVRAFFDELPILKKSPELLVRRFKTVKDVLRNRFDTEEKAVLPIFARCEDALA